MRKRTKDSFFKELELWVEKHDRLWHKAQTKINAVYRKATGYQKPRLVKKD